MDFIPDKEFHQIFNRVSQRVNLKGAGTPAEINARLNQGIKEYRYLQKSNRLEQSQARRNISNLRKMIFAGFGRRTIDEAIANPQGKIALTLRHGRETARDILLRRARERIGRLRLVRRR
jgi:hypothetical protein